MELQLYFYHHEINKLPEEVFSILDNDEKLLNMIEKLTDVEYVSDASNTRETGTKAVVQYGGSSVETEIVLYRQDRRIDLNMEIPAGKLVTMFNIVPVENRSEVTVSAKLYTDSPVTFALYALKIPSIKKQFNHHMLSLEKN